MKPSGGFFLKPSFVVCAAVLAVAASSKEYTIRQLGIHFIKYPLELKAPLDKLNERKLSPYTVINKARITNRDVLDSLGTEEYLQWELENPDVPKDSPTRYCSLFITYYTGNPDMVPHVPDECYVGGGNRRLSGEIIQIPLDLTAMETTGREIPNPLGAQSIVFSQTGKGPMAIEKEMRVQYFFKANGKYASSRTETRSLLGRNFFSRYSYFCKVEWKFYGMDYTGVVYPDRERTIEASGKLLSIVLPILEADHWPDWDKANQEKAK
jgi:hypothetical protein